MKARLNNQIFVDEDNYQDEYRFDVCRSIEALNKLPFEFYVNGGIICRYFFKDHNRYTNDIDIVTKCDLKEVESIFRKHLNVVEFIISPISDIYFVEAFTCLIEIDEKITQIDGMKVKYFDEIKPEIYKINDVSFKGLPIECVIALKIIAITGKPERPFKHLVDVFTASMIDSSLIDKQEIKKYVIICKNEENEYRNFFNKPEETLSFFVKKDKIFSGPEILTTLQAGYSVSKETMIEKVNEWLSTF